jgi:phosphoribosylpyrophosphate synthetase
MRPNPEAFAVAAPWRGSLEGARVLLLDDLYVSGSRAQSAAAALRRAGARPVLIVPMGRVIRPATIATHAALLRGEPDENGHGPRCLVVQTGAGKR